jgi:hypothetical protein
LYIVALKASLAIEIIHSQNITFSIGLHANALFTVPIPHGICNVHVILLY